MFLRVQLMDFVLTNQSPTQRLDLMCSVLLLLINMQIKYVFQLLWRRTDMTMPLCSSLAQNYFIQFSPTRFRLFWLGKFSAILVHYAPTPI